MRVKSLGHAAIFSLLVLGGGCVIDSNGGTPPVKPGPEPVPEPQPDPPSTSRGHLAQPRTFTVKPGGTATLTAKRFLGDDIVETTTLPILGGELVVQAQADGRLTVHTMSLDFGNIRLSAEIVPPNGLDLMDIKVSLERWVAETRWSSDLASAEGSAETELQLDWALQAAEGVLPLAPQRIEKVPLTLDIVPASDGKLTATVAATRAGSFFIWTGIIELTDLTLAVEATE
jgi:hypothetical protein